MRKLLANYRILPIFILCCFIWQTAHASFHSIHYFSAQVPTISSAVSLKSIQDTPFTWMEDSPEEDGDQKFFEETEDVTEDEGEEKSAVFSFKSSELSLQVYHSTAFECYLQKVLTSLPKPRLYLKYSRLKSFIL